MTVEGIRIFVDEQPLSVAPGLSLREVLAARDPALALALDRGTSYVTDGVGRPVDPNVRPATGAIFRVVRSARHSPRSSPT